MAAAPKYCLRIRTTLPHSELTTTNYELCHRAAQQDDRSAKTIEGGLGNKPRTG